MNTYGMYSIHGPEPAIATGLAVSRPDLFVWVVTGDADALLLFKNRMYGLTKDQLAHRRRGRGRQVHSDGITRPPFNPVSLALGAEAAFVGRALDSDKAGLADVLTAAAQRRGSALVVCTSSSLTDANDGSYGSCV